MWLLAICNFQIVFPIPEICEYLTEETKFKAYSNAERDDQVIRVTKNQSFSLSTVTKTKVYLGQKHSKGAANQITKLKSSVAQTIRFQGAPTNEIQQKH